MGERTGRGRSGDPASMPGREGSAQRPRNGTTNPSGFSRMVRLRPRFVILQSPVMVRQSRFSPQISSKNPDSRSSLLLLRAGSDPLQACSNPWRGSTDYAEQRVGLDASGRVRLARTPHNQELGIMWYEDHQ